MEAAAAEELYRPLGLKRSEALPTAGQRLAACSGDVQTHLGGNISCQPPGSPSDSLGPRFLQSAGCRRALIPTAVPWERCRLLHSHSQCQTAGRRDGLSLPEVPRLPCMLLEKSGKATDCCLPGIKIPREHRRCRLSQRCCGPCGINTVYYHPDLSHCQTAGQRLPWRAAVVRAVGCMCCRLRAPVLAAQECRAVIQRARAHREQRPGGSHTAARPSTAGHRLPWAAAHLAAPSAGSGHRCANQVQRFTHSVALLLCFNNIQDQPRLRLCTAVALESSQQQMHICTLFWLFKTLRVSHQE